MGTTYFISQFNFSVVLIIVENCLCELFLKQLYKLQE